MKRPTRTSSFADSNVLVYTTDQGSHKQEVAFGLLKQGLTISTQVAMEFLNVCVKKLKIPKKESFRAVEYLMESTRLVPVVEQDIRKAMLISDRYNFSHWDSLIVASALRNGCTVLYSEDMQHEQKIEGKLIIINPFLS